MNAASGAIGIIGGSGLYDVEEVADLREERITTPFGEPSDAFVLGRMAGKEIAFLARHGRGHRHSPSEINYRANIWGMKALGVERIIAVGAVGSMKEEIRPMDLVLPDQFIDRTRHRISTFFGDGIVAHVSLADPICPSLRRHLAGVARASMSSPAAPAGDAEGGAGPRVHDGGTYLCMEGPQFSTRAESLLYRSWGISVIGMTNVQEARLSREAEICYATLSMATDYDCWHLSEEAVTVETIIGYLKRNARTAREVIASAIAGMPARGGCGCAAALADAIITDRRAITSAAKERLSLLIGKYIS